MHKRLSLTCRSSSAFVARFPDASLPLADHAPDFVPLDTGLVALDPGPLATAAGAASIVARLCDAGAGTAPRGLLVRMESAVIGRLPGVVPLVPEAVDVLAAAVAFGL